MRPSKDEYYLNIAQQVALRSTCLRRQFGAVIVDNNGIVSTGYGGAPRDTAHCTDVGFCYRGKLGARPGEHYEFCRAVHAEQNAIMQASPWQRDGATLYLVGLDAKTKEFYRATEPCRLCRRQIVNAGIRLVVARQGPGPRDIKRFYVRKWVRNELDELKKVRGRLIPAKPPQTHSEPVDEERAQRLIKHFSLADAVVVQVASYEDSKQAVARVAARYFVYHVKTGRSVGLSCGDTILSMLESLPDQQELRLAINQLSIEADPRMIHQAPATLVGLLRSKCSPKSRVFGLQLPPLSLSRSSGRLREALVGSGILRKIQRDARASDYLFLGLGSAGPDSASFWAMAQAATRNKFSRRVKELGIVGEMNNQVFDASGKNCSDCIREFAEYTVNLLTLDDIRKMASKPEKHRVVMVATGPTKIEGMRVALEAGLANVLITGREDADRLLGD